MLSYYAKRSRDEQFDTVHLPHDGSLWVFGENVDDADIGSLVEHFDLDQNIIDDVLDQHELPRVEYDDGREYVFLRVPRLTKKGNVVTSPLLAIINHTNFFTLSPNDAVVSMESIAQSPIHSSQGAGLLLGTIASVVATYDDMIQHTSMIIKDTGARLRTHEVTNSDFIHFVTVEDNLNEYKMNLDGILAVTRRLKDNTHDLFMGNDLESLDDIILHIQQLLVGIETYEYRVESIRNAYSTIANNNLNERMKLLTALTVLVALPNVFYGMFGMNVDLPFENERWAYGAIVGFTVVLIVAVYLIARRFKIF